MIGICVMWFVGCLFFLTGHNTIPKKFDDIFGEIVGRELILDAFAGIVVLSIVGIIGDKNMERWVGHIAIFAPFIISVFLTFKNADEKR